MESVTPQPVCAKEAIDLLNCVTENPFDRDKCLRLLDGLRNCVLEKVIVTRVMHSKEIFSERTIAASPFRNLDSLLFRSLLDNSIRYKKVKRFSVADSSHLAEVPKRKDQ